MSIKTNVTGGCKDKTYTYPRLRCTEGGYVVLFIEQDKGILLKTPALHCPIEKIGSLHTFAERNFEDFEGSVELRNT